MKNKIDAVILFVDMNDEEWRQKYNNYIDKNKISNKHINNESRFRDYGTLRCLLRSIDLYAPWINNVFLVVQSESQVPEWINRETVKVVLHEEFIPKEFLPTFNCNTIEMFLHKIPNLSDYFIYFNDDTLLNEVNHKEDYFIGNKCVNYINIKKSDEIKRDFFSKWYSLLRFSNSKEMSKITGNEILDYVFYNSHGPTPMIKKLCEEVYELVDIKSSISKLRELKNLTQELFTIYALYKRKIILLTNSINRNVMTKVKNNRNYESDSHKINKKNILKSYKKTLCVNDYFNNPNITDNNFLYNEVEKILLEKYSNISKYENCVNK